MPHICLIGFCPQPSIIFIRPPGRHEFVACWLRVKDIIHPATPTNIDATQLIGHSHYYGYEFRVVDKLRSTEY